MTSFLSKEAVSVEIPDPININAEFVYNFYTPDESVRTAEGLSPPPRLVSISFHRVKQGASLWAQEELNKLQATGRFNASMVQPEYEVSTPGTTQLSIEDTDIGRRLQGLVMYELQKLYPDIDIMTSNLSQTDLANSLNDATSGNISGDIIHNLVSDFSGDGITFYNRDNKEIKNGLYADAASLKFDVQLSDKFAGDFFNNMSSNPLSYSTAGSLVNAEQMLEIQATHRKNTNAAILPGDYIPNVTYFDRSDSLAFHEPPKAGTCGYVIDKYIIDSTGRRVFLESIVLPNYNYNSFVDKKIVYGAVYAYELRVLSMIQMTVGGDLLEESPGTLDSKIFRIKFLVKSRASKQIKVKCFDNVPPPPTDLVTFRYDFENNRLAIKWKYPHTKQKDIKKFQVFKRLSIFKPFTLIAQFDFTDSLVPVDDIEYIDPAVNFRVNSGQTVCFDEGFDKSGDAIYSIVTVDAHNLTSNYSDQVRVVFNRSKNIIETTTISPSGAPKQYPNFFISTTMAQNIETVRYTEDVIRDSGHLKMKVYFDPETLKVLDQGRPCHFLTRTESSSNLEIPFVGKYKFQIINIDRQKSNILDINIHDKRTNRRS